MTNIIILIYLFIECLQHLFGQTYLVSYLKLIFPTALKYDKEHTYIHSNICNTNFIVLLAIVVYLLHKM